MSLPIPTCFSGNPTHWEKWRQRFERYRIASGLAQKPRQEQVSTFLYAMGECADDILVTLNIDEATASYEDTRAVLDTYFGARKKPSSNARSSTNVHKPQVRALTLSSRSCSRLPRTASMVRSRTT